jgi:hypothetical protein
MVQQVQVMLSHRRLPRCHCAQKQKQYASTRRRRVQKDQLVMVTYW